MSAEAEDTGRAGGGAPRSTLWRGILGSAPVVATALTLELGRTLVVDSFGEAEPVRALAGALRIVSVLLVAGALVLAAHRWRTRRRDADELGRIAELLDGAAEPAAEFVGRSARPDAGTLPLLAVPDEAAVLRTLPMREYDSATLLAVLTAITRARPAGGPAENATSVLRTLRENHVLVEIAAQRYRLDVPQAPPPSDCPEWAAALCALLRLHADRASVRALALGHPDHAAAARTWFAASEPELRDLAGNCVPENPREGLPGTVVVELVRILDALEVWYAESAPGGAVRAAFAALCGRVAGIAGVAETLPLQHDMLAVRAGQAVPARRFRPLRWSTAVEVRREHDDAVVMFGRSRSFAVFVRKKLETVWWKVPRTDIATEVCVLVNLAVVELELGDLDAAAEQLELVFARTGHGRDPAGRTHAHEIAGALRWMRGESTAAVRSWLFALTGYRALGNPQGTERCLHHLGWALLVAPDLGAVALDTRSGEQPSEARVWRQAAGWLAESARARWGDPAAWDCPRHVLDALGSRPEEIGRWPRELDDPHLRIPR